MLLVSCADSVIVITLSSEFSLGPQEFDEVATCAADLKNLFMEHLRITFPPFFLLTFELTHCYRTQLKYTTAFTLFHIHKLEIPFTS